MSMSTCSHFPLSSASTSLSTTGRKGLISLGGASSLNTIGLMGGRTAWQVVSAFSGLVRSVSSCALRSPTWVVGQLATSKHSTTVSGLSHCGGQCGSMQTASPCVVGAQSSSWVVAQAAKWRPAADIVWRPPN